MKLETMENEQLVDDLIDAHILGHPLFRSSDVLKAELLTRLASGDKAIKAMEKIDKVYINHRAYDDYVDSVRSIIDQYRMEKR
jgi:guanylate kinase